MNDGHVKKHTIYPAFTFPASPTYFAWVKLTARDIQSLTSESGFAGQGLYFHLNHPIRFVSLTAPIVAIEDLFSKYVLITVDDGSGVTIGVKVKRIDKDIAEQHKVELASNTTVSNLSVASSFGCFDVVVDGHVLDIGDVIKIKACIEDWRGGKQLDLKRLQVVRSTSQEILEWKDLARWKKEVLRRPWYLSRRKLQELQAQDEDVTKTRMAEERRAERREAAKLAKRRQREIKSEQQRSQDETRRRKEEVMMNSGALV